MLEREKKEEEEGNSTPVIASFFFNKHLHAQNSLHSFIHCCRQCLVVQLFKSIDYNIYFLKMTCTQFQRKNYSDIMLNQAMSDDSGSWWWWINAIGKKLVLFIVVCFFPKG
jgi:hypothetical protein